MTEDQEYLARQIAFREIYMMLHYPKNGAQIRAAYLQGLRPESQQILQEFDQIVLQAREEVAKGCAAPISLFLN